MNPCCQLRSDHRSPSHRHKLKCQRQSQYVSCKIHPCISPIWIYSVPLEAMLLAIAKICHHKDHHDVCRYRLVAITNILICRHETSIEQLSHSLGQHQRRRVEQSKNQHIVLEEERVLVGRE